MARLFWKNIAAIIAAVVFKVIKKFFRLKDSDRKVELVEKVVEKIFKGSAYSATDWALAGLTGIIVGYLKYCELALIQIFLVLWILNITISLIIIYVSKTAITDFTLADGFREATDQLILESRIAGYISEFLLGIRFLLWDGPDRFILYFEKRIPNKIGKILIFLIVSGVQMLIWAWLYSLGYDSVSGLIRSLF